METEWADTTLGQVVDAGNGFIQTGPFGSQLHASDYVPEGVPVIMPVNLAGNRVSLDEIARIREADAERLSRHLVQSGDIVYSRRGDVTRKALITDKEAGMFCGTGCLLVRPGNGVDPKFLTYQLSTPANQEWIMRHAIGATMPNLNTGILSGVPLRLPSREAQKAIAHILGTLDDKIELNRQMNATLEVMAQALFKSWFVDFDPVIDNALAAGNPIPEPLQPRAEARKALTQTLSQRERASSLPSPSGRRGGGEGTLPEAIQKQFPNRFVFNEEMGWVPEGWEIGSFGDIALHIRDNVKADEVGDFDFYVGLEHIGRKQLFLSEHGSGESVDSNKTKFGENDLLFGKLRPYFHKVCLAPQEGICSTDILVFRAKSTSSHSFMILTAFREDFVEYANLRSTGTRMPRASAKDMLNFPIMIPGISIAESFEAMASTHWKRGMQSIEESRNLASLRNTLLPKLLSGQLRIPEAEQQLAEAL